MKEIILISAMTKSRVIGNNNSMPWHLPEDLRRFRDLTLNHSVIMGRSTFESMGSKPLPNRRNIILTSKREYLSNSFFSNVMISPNLDLAFTFSRSDKAYIIGGGSIYKQALDRATKLELTIINEDYEGDTYFPKYEHLVKDRTFTLVKKEEHPLFTFMTYDRSDLLLH